MTERPVICNECSFYNQGCEGENQEETFYTVSNNTMDTMRKALPQNEMNRIAKVAKTLLNCSGSSSKVPDNMKPGVYCAGLREIQGLQ